VNLKSENINGETIEIMETLTSTSQPSLLVLQENSWRSTYLFGGDQLTVQELEVQNIIGMIQQLLLRGWMVWFRLLKVGTQRCAWEGGHVGW